MWFLSKAKRSAGILNTEKQKCKQIGSEKSNSKEN
jgi:hypothetical protein